jgi:hypothetical protein
MENKFTSIAKAKSDEELLEMVYQFDLWDDEMLQQVEDELEFRNILPQDIQFRKQELIKKEDLRLSKGKEASTSGQILGWIGIFGILGLLIGYTYCYSKTKSVYTGKEYFTYNEESREIGTFIFIISITTHALFLIYKITSVV